MAVFFAKSRDPFSNFYPVSFTVDDLKYSSSEQYFMASKARFFKDVEAEDQIMEAESPKEQRELGRSVKKFDPREWDRVKFKIMKQALLIKFQLPKMKKFLVESQRKVLVEAAPWDAIWGIGMDADKAVNTPFREWGKNGLGFLLMEVRDFLQGNWIQEDFGVSMIGNFYIGAHPTEDQAKFLLGKGVNLFVSLEENPRYLSVVGQASSKVFALPTGGIRNDQETLEFLGWLRDQYFLGKIIYLHSRRGIGRTGLIASLFLNLFLGYQPSDALDKVRKSIHSRTNFNQSFGTFKLKFMPIPETASQITQFTRLADGDKTDIDMSAYTLEAEKAWMTKLSEIEQDDLMTREDVELYQQIVSPSSSSKEVKKEDEIKRLEKSLNLPVGAIEDEQENDPLAGALAELELRKSQEKEELRKSEEKSEEKDPFEAELEAFENEGKKDPLEAELEAFENEVIEPDIKTFLEEEAKVEVKQRTSLTDRDLEEQFRRFANQELHLQAEEGTFVLQSVLNDIFNRFLEQQNIQIIDVDKFEQIAIPVIGEPEKIESKIPEYDGDKYIESKVSKLNTGYRVNFRLLPDANIRITKVKSPKRSQKKKSKTETLSEKKDVSQLSQIEPPKEEVKEVKIEKKLSSFLSHFFPGDITFIQPNINFTEETLHYMSPMSKADKLAALLKTYPRAQLVVDVFAGIGGNTLGFARAGLRVVAYERDPERFKMLRNNVLHYRFEKQVTTIRGEFNPGKDLDIIRTIQKIEADKVVFFFDPPWLPSFVQNFDKSQYILTGITLAGQLLEDIAKKTLQEYGGSIFHLPPGYSLNLAGRIVDDKSDNKARLIYFFGDQIQANIAKDYKLQINYATEFPREQSEVKYSQNELVEQLKEVEQQKVEAKLYQPPVKTVSVVFQTFLNKSFPRRSYQHEPFHPKAVHSGQRKLLLSEIEFLTRVLSKEKTLGKGGSYTMLYVGAAPGIHIPLLANKFPEVKFILYDPAKFDIAPSSQIEIHRELFTDEKVEMYKKTENLLFVSDIRSTPKQFDPNQSGFDSSFEQEVIFNMEQQKKWVTELQPLRSLLKFRLPYNDPENPRDEQETFKYLDGILFFQAYPPEQSGETRLEVGLPLKETGYFLAQYEQQMFYFNTRYRIQSFSHYSQFYGWSYDTLREYFILQNYYKFRGIIDSDKKIEYDFQDHDRMAHGPEKKIFNILRNAAKYG